MKEKIKQYIVEEIIEDPGFNLNYDDKIIEESIIDSTEIVKIILFLEDTYDVKIENDEIKLKNFNSVDDICNFIKRKVDGNEE